MPLSIDGEHKLINRLEHGNPGIALAIHSDRGKQNVRTSKKIVSGLWRATAHHFNNRRSRHLSLNQARGIHRCNLTRKLQERCGLSGDEGSAGED